MTQLQHLVLDLPDYNFIEQLLPVLAGLTQLRHLYLDYLDPVAAHFHAMDELEWDESDERDVNAQACAELTASTQLTHLAVRGYLLTFAGGYMFPEGRQLRQLVHSCTRCASTMSRTAGQAYLMRRHPSPA